MTRRLGVALAVAVCGLFAVGLWAVRAVRDIGRAAGDVIGRVGS